LKNYAWVRTDPTRLMLTITGPELNEGIVDPMQDWCRINLPLTRRISFDKFMFASEQDLAWFLLYWQ